MIVIALGSSLPSRAGTPRQTLDAALDALANNAIVPVKVSRKFESPAWPDPNEPKYTNAVVLVKTDRSPRQLMEILHEIEISFGRKRGIANAPRTLDLDLIDYEGKLEVGPPALPHPRMESRAFVLLPLADVAPSWVHPRGGAMLRDLISQLPPDDRAQTVPLEA
jgi:2-amino-4-hydroxy-6-hydroxymethyldihydropteridine diphosphokinase